jgi:LuxR family transcriptional regulator, maltose regulon positive regulatory protein
VERGRKEHLLNQEAVWALLAQGRWELARVRFEELLGVDDAPEIHEGLSWAAWWVDDAETVFRARDRAYRGYRERRDLQGAARMATWLAADELDFNGAVAVAHGWLRRAHRLLDPLEPGPDHGWLAFHDGYLAHQEGATDHALRCAAATADLGQRFGVVDLEMLGLALQGASLVACANVEEGMRCLDEAAAAALEGQTAIPIANAWTCCFLVSACSAVHDYERAFEWCDRIARFAERYGSRYMLAFCRAEYGAVHRWRGRWSDAEEVLEASIQDFTASRPAWTSGPFIELAELRRRQGRYDEAEELLDRAGPSAGAHLCRARCALDRGDARRAVDLADRLLRQSADERTLDRVPALELLVRARIARGELEEAGSSLASLAEAARLIGTEPMRATADLADGMLTAARGNHDGARPLLEDATDRFGRCGAPFEAATARRELANTLIALGRADEGRAEASAALTSFLELGAMSEVDRARRALDASNERGHGAYPGITQREREVLRLIADGLTNRQIAEQLTVSEHTVHRHVANILRKLDLPSRTAAAAYAVRADLLDRSLP